MAHDEDEASNDATNVADSQVEESSPTTTAEVTVTNDDSDDEDGVKKISTAAAAGTTKTLKAIIDGGDDNGDMKNLQNQKCRVLNLHMNNNSSRSPLAATDSHAASTDHDDDKKKTVEPGRRSNSNDQKSDLDNKGVSVDVKILDSKTATPKDGQLCSSDEVREATATLRNSTTVVPANTGRTIVRNQNVRGLQQPGAVWIDGGNARNRNRRRQSQYDDPSSLMSDAVDEAVIDEEHGQQQYQTIQTIQPITNDELEAEYRQRIIGNNTQGQVQGTVILVENQNNTMSRRKRKLVMIGATIVAIVGLAVVVIIATTMSGGSDVNNDATGTIDDNQMEVLVTTEAPTSSPTMPRTIEEQLLDYLVEKTSILYSYEQDSPSAHPLLDSRPTAQYNSYKWIVNNGILYDVLGTSKSNVVIDSTLNEQHGILSIEDGSNEDLRLMQYYAMSVFHKSTRGNNWSNRNGWSEVFDRQPVSGGEELHDGNICSNYYGIECNVDGQNDDNSDYDDVVSSLILNSNNLVGTIPPEIIYISPPIFDAMTVLSLSNNRLSTTLPTSIWEYFAPSLESLDISNNNLFGRVPTEIGLLTKLTSIKLLEGNSFDENTLDTLGKILPKEILDILN